MLLASWKILQVKLSRLLQLLALALILFAVIIVLAGGPEGLMGGG